MANKKRRKPLLGCTIRHTARGGMLINCGKPLKCMRPHRKGKKREQEMPEIIIPGPEGMRGYGYYGKSRKHSRRKARR